MEDMTGKTMLLATSNPGKEREVKSILAGIPYRILSLADVSPLERVVVRETGRTMKENAVLKATIVGKQFNLLTLADDSGLEIDALGGRPGATSARFAPGGDAARIAKVLRLMRGVPDLKRSARFKAVIAIFDPGTGLIRVFEGSVEGKITREAQGKRGFGYDPIFWVTELEKTFAQASLSEKNRVSHRARALRKAKKLLTEWTNSSRTTRR